MTSNAAKDFPTLLYQLEKKHHRVEQELQNMVKAQEKLYQFQEKIEQQKTIYAQIAEAGHQFNQSLNDDEVFKAVARICVDLLNFEKFALLMPSLSGKEFSIRIHGGYHSESEESHLANLKLNLNDPMLAPFISGQNKWQAKVTDQDPFAQSWKTSFQVDEVCVYSLGSSEGHLKGLLLIGNSQSNRSFHRSLAEEQELDALMGNVTSLIAGAQTAINFMQTIQSESAQVHRLLDNMKQAVFTVDAEGKINEPVSRQSLDIFKINLVGSSIYETVFKDLPQNGEIRSRLDSAMATVFGESDLQWTLMSDQFPTEFVFRLPAEQGEDVRVLRSTVQPIWDENEVLEKVMFVMEDITEIQKLEKQIEQEKFEVSVIRQILRNDLENVRSFFNQSADFLWKSLLLLETAELTPSAFSDLLRTLHTLKGNARLFGFIEISKAIHEAESGLLDFKGDLLKEGNLPTSITYLKVIEHFCAITTMIFDHVLVAEKVFRLQTDFKSFLFRFFILIIGRKFEEQGLHARLVTSLLSPLASGPDKVWIEDFQQKWEDLNSALTKNRDQIFSTALFNLRPIAVRAYLQSGFPSIPQNVMRDLLSQITKAHFSSKTPISPETHVLLEKMEPFFSRAPLQDQQWSSYVVLAAASEWSHLVNTKQLPQMVADLELEFQRLQISTSILKNEMNQSWNDLLDHLIQDQKVSLGFQVVKPWLENFLTHSLSEGQPIPLCRLFAFARALSPLLKRSESLASISQGTIEVSDINLKRLQQSVQSLSQRYVGDEEVQRLIQSFQRLSDVPLKPFLAKFEAMVTEVSSSLQKKVHFSIQGDDISVPRELLSHLQDVIVQLLRNAIDHGLENASERIQKKKSEYGSLEIVCRENESQLEIRVKDDGRGINPDFLADLSIQKGLLDSAKAQSLSREEKLNLIFLSGFSSKEEASDFSGRGVGMDIVKSTIESLKGQIKLRSQIHQGTEFELTLPLYFTSREI